MIRYSVYIKFDNNNQIIYNDIYGYSSYEIAEKKGEELLKYYRDEFSSKKICSFSDLLFGLFKLVYEIKEIEW